jgi:hypothetical protein
VSESRDELEAAIEARRELGRAHEPEVIDGFLERIERRLEERQRPQPPAQRHDRSFTLAVITMCVAIPLTAIAASNSGLAAVVVVWLGLVLVNVAYARRS